MIKGAGPQSTRRELWPRVFGSGTGDGEEEEPIRMFKRTSRTDIVLYILDVIADEGDELAAAKHPELYEFG